MHIRDQICYFLQNSQLYQETFIYILWLMTAAMRVSSPLLNIVKWVFVSFESDNNLGSFYAINNYNITSDSAHMFQCVIKIKRGEGKVKKLLVFCHVFVSVSFQAQFWRPLTDLFPTRTVFSSRIKPACNIHGQAMKISTLFLGRRYPYILCTPYFAATIF